MFLMLICSSRQNLASTPSSLFYLFNLFIFISNLKAEGSITDDWSFWNYENYNNIKDETNKYSVATVTAVLVCTKLLHSLVSKSRVKREFVKVGMEGFGIISQFDIKAITVPGILQTLTGPVGPLCLEIQGTMCRYSGRRLADEGSC